jgi:hypothetical protein
MFIRSLPNILQAKLEFEYSLLYFRVHVRPIHLDILPSLSDEESESIRYIHIDEIPEQYSLGIFVFPPFARIPLHDHPNMVVLSRVLYGDVTVRSYDIIHPSKGHVSDPEKADMNKESTIPSKNENPTEKHWYANILPAMKDMFSTHVNKAMHESHSSISTSGEDKAHQHNPAPLRVQENASFSLAAPQVSTLFPHSGNVHEFTAGKNGAAILDYILPPYDTDHDRDCTFYVEKEMTVPGETKRDEMDVEQKQCWLLPIPSPSDFHCVTGHYRYLGKSVDIE